MKHKHADLIHAWADGAKIQTKTMGGNWVDCHGNNPDWLDQFEYRIKPEPVVLYVNEFKATGCRQSFVFETREEAESCDKAHDYIRTIKLMEVTE